MDDVFVVTMYRGVWSSEEKAKQAGHTEALWRGGKYVPEVTIWKIDANEYDDVGKPTLEE